MTGGELVQVHITSNRSSYSIDLGRTWKEITERHHFINISNQININTNLDFKPDSLKEYSLVDGEQEKKFEILMINKIIVAYEGEGDNRINLLVNITIELFKDNNNIDKCSVNRSIHKIINFTDCTNNIPNNTNYITNSINFDSQFSEQYKISEVEKWKIKLTDRSIDLNNIYCENELNTLLLNWDINNFYKNKVIEHNKILMPSQNFDKFFNTHKTYNELKFQKTYTYKDRNSKGGTNQSIITITIKLNENDWGWSWSSRMYEPLTYANIEETKLVISGYNCDYKWEAYLKNDSEGIVINNNLYDKLNKLSEGYPSDENFNKNFLELWEKNHYTKSLKIPVKIKKTTKEGQIIIMI